MTHGLLSNYWHRKIDREFRSLLEITDMHLSISDAMSEEYLKRYGRSFRAFHNPIDPEHFNITLTSKISGDNRFRILYIGRIGIANKKILVRFATFMSKYEPDGLSIEFVIYTKDIDNRYARKLAKMHKVSVIEAVSHNEIPRLLKSYDLLLLPLDFAEAGLKFSKLSMPTKASEYMMSGTPMLVFAPEETAISRFCRRSECAHCVSTPDNRELAKAIDLLSKDKPYRERLSTNAMNLAEQLFDVRVVREEFKNLLLQLIDQGLPK